MTLKDLIGQRVELYFHHPKQCWSVRMPKGRVVLHTTEGIQLADVRWRVDRAKHLNAQRTQVRDVCAWIQGRLVRAGAYVGRGSAMKLAIYRIRGPVCWTLNDGEGLVESVAAVAEIIDNKPYAWTTAPIRVTPQDTRQGSLI
jgi:hypothetical protein